MQTSFLTGSPLSVPAGIFRKYDIRGEVETELTPENVYQIARSIGTQMRLLDQTSVIVGRDGRLSGPVLSEALRAGLMSVGLEVIDIGMVPSPVLYFATKILKTQSGVMLTGSHNPPKYNGLKVLIAGETLSGDQIYALYERLQRQDFYQTQTPGHLSFEDVRDRYIDRIAREVILKKPLKIVLDSGNGVTGELAPQVFRAMGCEVIELFTDIDGTFPNHHPDPLKPENLVDLQKAVAEHHADIGLAFDGDGDRVGVVSNESTVVWPDRLLMLLAEGVLAAHPGATILFDVKCSKFLADVITQKGGKAVMSATGHSIMKANLKKTGAELAGELSGHIFYKDRWYGFDDGTYAGARLLELISASTQTVSEIFSQYPDGISTPELNIAVTESEKFDLVETLVSAAQKDPVFQSAKILTIDGMRIEFEDGWILLRASNTTPNLVLRFEANEAGRLQEIQGFFRKFMTQHAPQVHLNF